MIINQARCFPQIILRSHQFGNNDHQYFPPSTSSDTTTDNNHHHIVDAIRQFDSLVEDAFDQRLAEIRNLQAKLDVLLDAAEAPHLSTNDNDDDDNGDDDDTGNAKSSNTSRDTESVVRTTFQEESSSNEEEEIDPVFGMAPEVIQVDVCIVGGGPAGCTCALYTARAGHRTVILDKNAALGALAITSHIANYPGVPDQQLSGENLLDRIRQQAVFYGADYRRAQVFMIDGMESSSDSNNEPQSGENLLDRIRQQAVFYGADYRRAQVFMIDGMESSSDSNNEPQANEFTVSTPDAIFKTRTLVLATGAMGRVSPPFPGEDAYLGMGVSYCATCDGAFYRDADVAIKGISLEAMEEARFLTKYAKTVHWVTASKPKLENSHHVQDLLACGNVRKWPLTKFLSVEGNSITGVTGIWVKQKSKDEPELIPVEGVFIYAGGGGGSKPITDFIGRNTVEYNKDGGVTVDDSMETNVKSVYAIGDIRNSSHKQVVVASSDGCIAAMSIDKYLNGYKNIRVDWIHK